jgi:hypothetical protein
MHIVVNNPSPFDEGGDRFQIGRIRVWPRTEEIRKYIRHPLGNIKFRATIYDSVEWPFEQFTKRRIKDKTVLTEPPEQPWPEPAASDEPQKSQAGDALPEA